jgi:hypothetical protein
MADGDETILRNALDAVDRGRRLALVGIGALFVAMIVALAAMMAVAAHTGSSTSTEALMLKTLYVSAAAQMLFMACCAALVMFQGSRTARTILRSIELAGRPRS